MIATSAPALCANVVKQLIFNNMRGACLLTVLSNVHVSLSIIRIALDEISIDQIFNVLFDVCGGGHELVSNLRGDMEDDAIVCLLYTSPSPRDVEESRMPSSA